VGAAPGRRGGARGGRGQARALADRHGVPLYDARIVGYPKRMREYERGIRRRGISLDEMPPLEVVKDPRRTED